MLIVLWGSNDLTTPMKAAEEFSRLIKNSQLVVIDNVDHEWSLWFVEKFTNLIFNFIDGMELYVQAEQNYK